MVSPVLLFSLVCIPTRLLLALYSDRIPPVVFLLIGLSFVYLYFTNGRLSAPEAGGKTWWAQYRIIIGLLYLTAALYGFQGKMDLVKYPLLVDVAFGIFLTVRRYQTRL